MRSLLSGGQKWGMQYKKVHMDVSRNVIKIHPLSFPLHFGLNKYLCFTSSFHVLIKFRNFEPTTNESPHLFVLFVKYILSVLAYSAQKQLSSVIIQTAIKLY